MATPAASSIVVVSQDQGYRVATCPLEIVELRRQFEEKALFVSDVSVAHPSITAASPLEIEELRRQFEEIALLVPDISLANPTITEVATAQPFYIFTDSAALVAIARVPAATGKEDVLLLCNEGAQMSKVRHSVAQRLGAGPGIPWTLSIQVVGEELRDIHNRLYDIHLKDKSGHTRSLLAVGIDSISKVNQPLDLSAVLKILPETNPEALVRPHGDIDVLIGACNARLLPFGGARVGNLRLENPLWGYGKVLRGSHPCLPLAMTPQLTQAALGASRASLHQPQGGQAYQGVDRLRASNMVSQVSTAH